MNEGWATFWHSRLLTSGILDSSEIVEFADCHSGATLTSPGQINPYKLGTELFRHAHRQARDVFLLRSMHNDVSFIDDVVDEEFAIQHQLFVYQRNARSGKNEVAERDWRTIKEELLRSLAWGGAPQIELISDQEGGGELLLLHHHDGRDLKLDEAGELLRQLATLWGRSVHLLTLEEKQGRRLTSNGEEVDVVESNEAEARCGNARSESPRDTRRAS
jgi:stage V sporulation protein R